MMHRFSFILLLFLSAMAFAQREKLHGRVMAGDASIPNIFVINKLTGDETKTDYNGNFYIEAKAGDGIAVYGNGIETRDFTANAMWFETPPVILAVEVASLELKEVLVESGPDEESLGLVPKGQKQYTPAERKLYTATSGLGVGTLIGLDPILNAITGRTKMLKAAVETEKKEFLIDKINGIYSAEHIMTEFKIPEENVNAFIYYVVEDAEFAAAMKADNETLAKFLMTGLAQKYLKLLSDE